MSKYLKSPYIILVTLMFVFGSCQKSATLDDLPKLNGYWEITSVETKEGKNVAYKFNETVDFIEVQGTTGLRTKVKPQLDGTFIKTHGAESFTAGISEDKIILHYKTNFNTWDERILYLDDVKLITKNDRDISYTYRRFTGYLDNNGQTE